MKKGFTLVELIAVITFITLIILVSTPLVLNQISSSRETKYKVFESDLCLAAESYLTHENNIEGIDSFNGYGDYINISVGDLISKGYVKSDTVNPKTKENILSSDKVLVVINEDGGYSCELNGTPPSDQNVETASQLSYNPEKTNLSCQTVQCALDEISNMVN